MIGVEINAEEFRLLSERLGATEEIANKALVSSINRVQRWVVTQSARAAAKAAAAPVASVRARARIRFADKGDISGSIWIGLNPVGAHRLRPRQTKAGVSAGKHRLPGAFIATGKSGKPIVFKREGRARLPIEKQEIEIEAAARPAIENQVWPLAQKRLLDEFTRQLRFRMSKHYAS